MIINPIYNTVIESATISYDKAQLSVEPIRHQICTNCNKILIILFTIKNDNLEFYNCEILNRDFKELDAFYFKNHDCTISSVYTHENEQYLIDIKSSIDIAIKSGYNFTYKSLELLKRL